MAQHLLILNVHNPNIWNTSLLIMTWFQDSVCYGAISLNKILQRVNLPPVWISLWIAEHIEEGRLEQGVELGEGLAALGP